MAQRQIALLHHDHWIEKAVATSQVGKQSRPWEVGGSFERPNCAVGKSPFLEELMAMYQNHFG